MVKLRGRNSEMVPSSMIYYVNGELVQLLIHQYLDACGNETSIGRLGTFFKRADRRRIHRVEPCLKSKHALRRSLDTMHGQVSKTVGASQTRSSSQSCVRLSIYLACAMNDSRGTTQLSTQTLSRTACMQDSEFPISMYKHIFLDMRRSTCTFVSCG